MLQKKMTKKKTKTVFALHLFFFFFFVVDLNKETKHNRESAASWRTNRSATAQS